MANLKNITDLPIAESAEGINLIVNDNGSAKQIAASAVGGGGVKSWNDLEDKPFGVKTEMVEIVPEQSVTHVRLVGDRYQAGFNLPIEGGKDYVVVINGTKYECVSTEGGTIGNNTTQYPFIFRSDIASQYWSAELGSPITLEIYEPEVVKQIDSKYMPNIAYFKGIDIENLVCVNMSFKEASDHIVSGNPLTCVVMLEAGGQFLNASSLTVQHVRDSGLITFTVMFNTQNIPTYVWDESGKIIKE